MTTAEPPAPSHRTEDEAYNLAARVHGDAPPSPAPAASGNGATVATTGPDATNGAAAIATAPEFDGAEPPAGGRHSLRTFDSLRLPAFRWYFLAMLGQNAGMNMQMLVRAFLTFELTGSFTALGVMSLASAIPLLVLSPVGGVIADRMPKRYVLQAGQTASMLNALAVAALLVFGTLRFEHLFIASFVQGTTMALMLPSRQSMVAEIVGTRRLMNAIALQSSGMSAMRMVAPTVGGILLATVAWQWVYFLMAAMYLSAIVTLGRVPAKSAVQPDATATRRRTSGLSDLIDGLRYVAANRVILMLLSVNLFAVMLSMPYQQLLAGFVKDVLHEGPERLGVLMSVTAIGSLAGALVIASLPSKRRGKLWLLGLLIMGLALLAFSISTAFWVTAAIMVAIGVGQTTRMSLSNVLVQSYVDDAYRGRVMSIYMMEFGLVAFGTFAISMLAAAVGVQWAIGGTAVGLVVLALGLFAFVPRLRELD